MLPTITPLLRTAAAAAFLSAVLIAPASFAQSATPAQQTAGQKTQAAAKTPRTQQSPAERVEARIKELHDKLHITAAQAPQWDAVTQAMRDNAKSMDALLKARAQTIKTASAIDDLHSYQALADAHSDGLKKFVPAFEALYGTMSDDQKKIADDVFRAHQQRFRGKRSSTK
jgi:protein CpxP